LSTQVDSLIPLFSPRGIAVVGASRDATRVGAKLLDNIITSGFKGEIYPINPKAEELHGLKAYPNLGAVPRQVDLALIAVPAENVISILKDCVRYKVGAVIIISAGFAEASATGKALQNQLQELSRQGPLRIVGPNCLGLINTAASICLNATFSQQVLLPGNVAIASQSGGVGLVLLDFLAERGVGLSSFVSIGNRVDVSSNDLLEYWEQDSRTDVIALYLESLGNPEKFCQIATRVSKKKPIVAIKAGHTQGGQRAAASHSAALAGEARYVKALFEKAGIIQARSVEELLDLVAFLRTGRPLRGPRVCVITNTGGPGILLADALEDSGLTVPVLSAATQAKLSKILDKNASLVNPIDMLASATIEDYREVLTCVAHDELIDSIAIMQVPIEINSAMELRRNLPQVINQLEIDKPIVSIFMSSATPEKSIGETLYPNFYLPERAAAVYSHSYHYSCWKSRPSQNPFVFDSEKITQLQTILCSTQISEDAEGWLPYTATSTILMSIGITLPKAVVISREYSLNEVAELKYPLVAKILAPRAIHKQDIGGVILNIGNQEQLSSTIKRLSNIAQTHSLTSYSFLIQEQISKSVEGFIGGIRDPECGPVIIFGLGGKFVQLMDDVAAIIPPLGLTEVEESLSTLRFDKILSGYRGDPKADRNAFVDLILRVGALLSSVPEIVELDLNPVLVMGDGAGATVADARIRLAQSLNVKQFERSEKIWDPRG